MFVEAFTHVSKVTISERGRVERSMRIDYSDWDMLSRNTEMMDTYTRQLVLLE